MNLKKDNQMSYKLSDEVISQIAKLVQIAILTGTDVIDNLRMIRVQPDDDDSSLILTKEYSELGENQINSLLNEIKELKQEEG
jgi:hypothetical protein